VWNRSSSRALSQGASGVDSHDVRTFPAAAWRARVLRLVFGTAAVALIVAAAASARNLESKEAGLLPSGRTGVVVVDLSLSILDDDYNAVRRALRRLIAEDASIGLVVFSDVAYELLPPGTPASELEPMLRLLVPPKHGPTVNPWTGTFRSGTQISTALELAKGMLERDGVDSGSILLVSDLETAPDDVPALAGTIASLRKSDIDLRVSALAPSSDARLLFADFLQEGAFDAPSTTGEEPATRSEAAGALPVMLVVLGAFFFVALAAHERFTGRLAITGASRRRE
jgi:hypothetical protein